MKLYTNNEVLEMFPEHIGKGWAIEAEKSGLKFISQLDRWVFPIKDDTGYYEKGKSPGNLHVSSSSLQYINPEEGGSPRAFIDFVENGIEETKNMRIGTIIHKYHEDRDSFKISEVPKPTEKAGEVADKIIQLVRDGEVFSNAVIQFAVESLGYQSNWKMETRINKIVDLCSAYINEVLEAEENNQIFLTESEMEPIKVACRAIESHPVACQLAFHSNNDLTGDVSFKELEIFAKYQIHSEDALDGHILTLKSKIDNVIINLETKVIKIIDLKSSINGGMRYTTQFSYRRTYRQLSFYGLQVKKWLKDNGFNPAEFTFEFYIISVQTTGLGECTVFKIPLEYINDGVDEVKTLLKRIAFHHKESEWRWSWEEINNNYVVDMPYVKNS